MRSEFEDAVLYSIGTRKLQQIRADKFNTLSLQYVFKFLLQEFVYVTEFFGYSRGNMNYWLLYYKW